MVAKWPTELQQHPKSCIRLLPGSDGPEQLLDVAGDKLEETGDAHAGLHQSNAIRLCCVVAEGTPESFLPTASALHQLEVAVMTASLKLSQL